MAVILVLIPSFAKAASLADILHSTNRTGICELSPSWIGQLKETSKSGVIAIPVSGRNLTRFAVPRSETNRTFFFNVLVPKATNEIGDLIPALLGRQDLQPSAMSGQSGRQLSNLFAKLNGTAHGVTDPEQYEFRSSLPQDHQIMDATNKWQLVILLGESHTPIGRNSECNWNTQPEEEHKSWRLFSLSADNTAELACINVTFLHSAGSVNVRRISVMRGVARPMPAAKPE